MTQTCPILIADDHPVVLAGLRQFLQQRHFDILASATSVPQLLSALRQHDASVVVTDYSFGGDSDGMRMIERIRRIRPAIGIVVFSRVHPTGLVQRLLSHGADAFVSKSVGLEVLVEACDAVQHGRKFVDAHTQAILNVPESDEPDAAPEAQLSVREREVLRLLARGFSIRQIAACFQRSPKTISVQKCAAMSKLGLQSELELALYLARAGEL